MKGNGGNRNPGGPRLSVGCPGSGSPADPALRLPTLAGDVVLRYGTGTCPECRSTRAIDQRGTIRPHRARKTTDRARERA